MKPAIFIALILSSNIILAEDSSSSGEHRIQELEARIEALEKQPTQKKRQEPLTHEGLEALVDSFGNTTESRSQANRRYADRVEQVLQDFIEIDGYFRAGYGHSNEGGNQVGFKAPGAMAKYRLGNEAENFGELIFGKNFFMPGAFNVDDELKPKGSASGPIAHVQFRLEFFNPYDEFSSSSETNVGLPEAWASIGNVLTAMPEAKFWAGNRFYRRHDIGLNDFFFWNMSGGGAGIEDVSFAGGKFAAAWIGTGSTSGFTDLPQPDPENKAGFSKTNIDLRWYAVPLLGGEMELGLIYSQTESGLDSEGNRAQDTDGYAINVIHTIDEFISQDGANKFSIQYGTQAAKTFTSGFETININGGSFIQPDLDGSWRFRITENFSANINEHFSIGPVLIYQTTEYGGGFGKQSWYSAGVRPIYHFNERMSIAFEGGWDKVEQDYTDSSGSLYKLTIAPQISLGGSFNSRPVIRAFVTWASWSDDFIGEVGGIDYASKSEGITGGVQMEAWW
ncbi:maltoporin [Alteromonadaceae bacterium Bs31]|nr:maltoporin [Alteromonadaceae bacterium Bs31]